MSACDPRKAVAQSGVPIADIRRHIENVFGPEFFDHDKVRPHLLPWRCCSNASANNPFHIS
jgi:hypothetical protein